MPNTKTTEWVEEKVVEFKAKFRAWLAFFAIDEQEYILETLRSTLSSTIDRTLEKVKERLKEKTTEKYAWTTGKLRYPSEKEREAYNTAISEALSALEEMGKD